MPVKAATKTIKKRKSGKLRIGDNWNAISIIALSQSNPLKAIAEFVENSIDAKASNITIVRGKERGELYFKVIDDGNGIPLNSEGAPDFKYVATHICDSIKQRLKEQGIEGIQGEFGIGLLSFWTVGENLYLSSSGNDGKVYQMEMNRNEPGYTITQKRTLIAHPGTELVIHPVLPGLKQLSGEKIQNYLASELRDRIRKSGVRIKIKDRHSRKEFDVQPRQYTGRLIHECNTLETEQGDIYLELYLNAYSAENCVSLFRSGTRVVPAITEFYNFNKDPWSSGYLQGMIDVPFLQLTPGTRGGVVQDRRFEIFCQKIEPLEGKLLEIIEQEKKAEEEEASRNILRSVQRALKEAFLALQPEDYNWFDIYTHIKKQKKDTRQESIFSEDEMGETRPEEGLSVGGQKENGTAQKTKEFYEYAGPLHSVVISPTSTIVKVNETKSLRCIPRDKNKRVVEHDFEISWEIKEGEGALTDTESEIVKYTAPEEPGYAILKVTVVQGANVKTAESIVTITESLITKDTRDGTNRGKGLPGYTYFRAPGELWRSKYDEKNNVIVINNGHRDYLYSSQKRSRKLKYICRLFAKELVLINFIGYESPELLERMIELSLYTEEHLK